MGLSRGFGMGKNASLTLIDRFSGKNGRKRLIEALLRQKLVAGQECIALKIARVAKRHEFRSGQRFIAQGMSDNDLYFILSGSVSITVNGRKVAERHAGEHVGEMALIDTTARRSASVTAIVPTVVAKITEPQFTRLANRNPELWRRVAVELGSRLRERSQFHPSSRSAPVIFIGSSGEGLAISDYIANYLRRYPFIVRLWSDGVFESSKTTIEDLITAAKESDFAILVLTPDDITRSRGIAKASPRDNVIFELGLFMGGIARHRTYIVADAAADLKIPTDLLGITYLRFRTGTGRSLARQLLPVMRTLRDLIRKYGPV